MKRTLFPLAAVFALIAAPALAHTGTPGTSGLMAGFAHPIGGLDHILAMVAVGILSAQHDGRNLWLLPAAFVGMMMVGGILGVAGLAVPFVEQGIVGSIVILGGVVALGRRMPVALAVGLVGVLAVFHGHAHGTEMPLNASGLAYGFGFAAATAMLHVIGIGLGFAAGRIGDRLAPLAVRVGGGAIAAAGVALAAV